MRWIRYSLVLLSLIGNACFVHCASSTSVGRQVSGFLPNSSSDDVTFDVPLSGLEVTVPLPGFIANEADLLSFVSPTPSITPTTSPSMTPSASPTPSRSAQPSKPAASLPSPTPSSSSGILPIQSLSVSPSASSSPNGPDGPTPTPDPGTQAPSTSPEPSPSASVTPSPSSSPPPQQDPSKLRSLTRRRNQRRRRSNIRDNGTFPAPECGCLPAGGVPNVGTKSNIDAVIANLPTDLPANSLQTRPRLNAQERNLNEREAELEAIAFELSRLGSQFDSIETSLEASLLVAAQAAADADDSEADLIAREEAISDPSDLYEPRTSQIARQIRRNLREENVILSSESGLESAIAEREAQIAARATDIAEDDDVIENLLGREEAARQRETDVNANNKQRRRRRGKRLNLMFERLNATASRLVKTLEILTLRKATVEDNIDKLELLAKLEEVRKDRIVARADYVWALGGSEP